MNQKETAELRRRLKPDGCAIRHIYGCYVNGAREIVATIDAPLGILPEEESARYLALLQKTLSGTMGKNLLDAVFSTEQVMNDERHALLRTLRDTQLKDEDARQTLYERVIASLDAQDGGYVILLAHDSYDVPLRASDDRPLEDAGDAVFSYILCSVCPVKDGRVELGFVPDQNEFHAFAPGRTVGAPELGFLFPAFDGRAANLYGALAYTRKPEEAHDAFWDAVFGAEPPMTAPAQRDAFHAALTEALAEKCSMEVAQTVHEELLDRLSRHKESRDPEPLAVSVREVSGILRGCGVEEETAAAFCARCEERFGENAALSPANLIDTKRFEIKTRDVTVSMPPDQSGLVETRVIDGRRYLLIPVEEGLEVNGLPVR